MPDEPPPGPDREDVRRAEVLAHRLAALPEVAMRKAVLAETLRTGDAARDCQALAEIVRRGRRGGPPFDLALLAFGALLEDPDALPYERRAALYTAARDAGLLEVADLFLSAVGVGDIETPPVPNLGGRALTLGERKALARGHRREILDRLMRDPAAPVMRILLANPRLTERDVVVIAARRPQLAEVQREIASARRWISRYAVKVALVCNPYTPTDLAIRLLGFLAVGDLRQVAADQGLSPIVRTAAQRRLRAG
jgi:hypothetical protein